MKKVAALVVVLILLFLGYNYWGGSDESGPNTPSSSSSVPSTSNGKNDSKTPPSTSSQLNKYNVEEGMAEYKVDGTRKGTKTVYWKQYGLVEAVYTDVTTTVGTISVPEKTISLTLNDGKVRTYDLLTNQGSMTDVPEEFANISAAQAEQMKQALGKETGETKTVLGRTCSVFESMGMAKICNWEQLPLYTEAGLQGTPTFFTEEVVKLELGATPADKYKLPVADSELRDMGNPLDMIKNIPKMPKQ